MSTEDKVGMRLGQAMISYRRKYGKTAEPDYDNPDVEGQIARIEEAVRTGKRLPGDSLKAGADENREERDGSEVAEGRPGRLGHA